MSLDEFAQLVARELEVRLAGEAAVSVQRIVKNNGQRKLAVCVRRAEEPVAPAIYLEAYYLRYRQGEPFELMLRELLVLSRLSLPAPFKAEDFLDWGRVQKRVVTKLVSARDNRALLSELPHRCVLDLVVLYYIYLEIDSEAVGQAVISSHQMQMWGIEEEALYAAALRNQQEILPPQICHINEILQKYVNVQEDESMEQLPLYVVTNARKYLGASAILCPGVMEQLLKDLGWRQAFVLPSSIHEVMVIPADGEYAARPLRSIVRDINLTAVRPEDRLSGSVYTYDRQTNTLNLGEQSCQLER